MRSGTPPWPARLALGLLAACLFPAAPTRAAEEKADAPSWVGPMQKVHARFTGRPGTFALFGDSITVSLAFWAPLQNNPKGLGPEGEAALKLVKGYLRPECWRDWRGPDYGNNSSMTIRWADENVGKWLKKLNPETALIMFGTNDLTEVPLDEYEKKTRAVVQKCLDNGTVVILSTIPPRSGMLEKSKQYAEAARRVARDMKVPLCDFFAECLKRRPDDWDGAAAKFKEYKDYDVPTLIARDGVHPSNPGKYAGDFSAEALKNHGFALRNYVSLLAYADVIRHVLRKPKPSKEGRPPNFVIIFTDDQGYADVGCFGAKGFQTPNLDRMAREGMRLTNFYAAQPVCSASRTALLTGCYPNRVGILGALNPSSKHGISDSERTLAQVLKPRGYATAIYGKWHLGHHSRFLPTRHGFDDYFGLPYSNDMWPKHPTAKFPPLPLIEGEKTVATNPDQTQLTTWYTERAVKFIEKSKDRPFFLYVAHSMPHVPLHVSDKFKGKSRRGLYGDVIMEIDWSVGQILAALKKAGVDDRTLVLFSSDNGPWLSYGEHAGSAGPLREGKLSTWDGGQHEPCIVRWPGRVPAGAVCKEPLMTIDVLPTFAGLAGAALPQHKIDGLDVWPLLSGQPGATSPHEALYFYWGRDLQAVRGGKWKLHFPHTFPTLAGKSGGKGGKPAPYSQGKTGVALYDLDADAGETTNVADQHPDVVQRLQTLAEMARGDLGDASTRCEGKGVRPPGRLEEAPRATR
jgi:arylsulfatase A-like enzyme/lysophospholipase L1-like esterase